MLERTHKIVSLLSGGKSLSHVHVFTQVEMLYQRYFLRMNQSNTTHILALLLTLILALSCTHLVFTTLQLRRNLDMTTTTTTMTPPAAVELLLLLAENGTAGNVSLARMTPSTTSTTSTTTTMATLAMLQPQQMGHQLVAANAPGSRLLLAQRVKRKHYRRQHSKQRYKQQQQHQRQLQHHHQLHRHRVR